MLFKLKCSEKQGTTTLDKHVIVNMENYGWINIFKIGKHLLNAFTCNGTTYNVDPEYDVSAINELTLMVPWNNLALEQSKPFMFQVTKKMPKEVLITVRKIFGKISESLGTEAVVLAFYNKRLDSFEVIVPVKQKISGASYSLDSKELDALIMADPDRQLCLEIHSHPFGHHPGFFSGTDNSSFPKYNGRVYANITFTGKKKDKTIGYYGTSYNDIENKKNKVEDKLEDADKFGYALCKFPGMEGFIDLNTFFEEVPNPDDLLGEDITDPEILKDLATIIENNKTPVYSYHGGSNVVPYRGANRSNDDYDDYMYGQTDFGFGNPHQPIAPSTIVEDKEINYGGSEWDNVLFKDAYDRHINIAKMLVEPIEINI
jgi:hypothetical protein